MIRKINVALMLDHRRKQWPNINPTFAEHVETGKRAPGDFQDFPEILWFTWFTNDKA